MHRGQRRAPARHARHGHRESIPARGVAERSESSVRMNVFQLVLKQMRQRALSSWLTMLSVLLGVALAIAIVILRRESAGLFGQKDFGYDVIVGAKGSPLQLTLNTVYHIDQSPGNIPYSLYEQMLRDRDFRGDIKIA